MYIIMIVSPLHRHCPKMLHVFIGDTMDAGFVNAGSKSNLLTDESIPDAGEITSTVQSPLTPVIALR